MLTSLRGRLQRSDSGITLVELAVVMGLMLVVGLMSMTFFVNGNRVTNAASDLSYTTGSARAALSSITSTIRLADTPTSSAGYSTARFTTIAPNNVVFYSNTDDNRTGSLSRSAPAKISFLASGTKLTEYVYQPLTPFPADYTTNYPSTPTTTTVLVDNLANTSVFTYNAIDPNTGGFTTATTGTSVASVTVTLVLNGLRGEASQTLTSTAGITGALS